MQIEKGFRRIFFGFFLMLFGVRWGLLEFMPNFIGGCIVLWGILGIRGQVRLELYNRAYFFCICLVICYAVNGILLLLPDLFETKVVRLLLCTIAVYAKFMVIYSCMEICMIYLHKRGNTKEEDYIEKKERLYIVIWLLPGLSAIAAFFLQNTSVLYPLRLTALMTDVWIVMILWHMVKIVSTKEIEGA